MRLYSYQRSVCLRSGGLLKPSPVYVGKLSRINILSTLMSRHHCINILCVPSQHGTWLHAAPLLKLRRKHMYNGVRGEPHRLTQVRPSTRCVLWLHEQHNCNEDGSRPSNKDIQVFLLNHYYDAVPVMVRC